MTTTERRYPGPRRRRVQPEDAPLLIAITTKQAELEGARMLRDAAVRDAFAAGIHYLDIQAAAGVARRTARGWADRYASEFGGPDV